MKFYLSTSSPINSAFTNEDGQAIYKVETPLLKLPWVTSISRVIPNDLPQEDADPDMRDNYTFMAQIEFHDISPSKITLVGSEFTAKSYFRKEGWGIYGRHRAFTGPDGLEYKWLLKATVPELILNDGSETTVAKFHKKSGIAGGSQPACLEIFPIGEHMVDTILVTFIYVEKKRRNRERALRSSGA